MPSSNVTNFFLLKWDKPLHPPTVNPVLLKFPLKEESYVPNCDSSLQCISNTRIKEVQRTQAQPFL